MEKNEKQAENMQQEEISEAQLTYLVEGMQLEVNKMYLELEIFSRRIRAAEQEMLVYKQLLLDKQKERTNVQTKYNKVETVAEESKYRKPDVNK